MKLVEIPEQSKFSCEGCVFYCQGLCLLTKTLEFFDFDDGNRCVTNDSIFILEKEQLCLQDLLMT